MRQEGVWYGPEALMPFDVIYNDKKVSQGFGVWEVGWLPGVCVGGGNGWMDGPINQCNAGRMHARTNERTDDGLFFFFPYLLHPFLS